MIRRPRVPRVSVVMGVRDGGEKLVAAVESILSQTYQDFEFLVVDDGSTDSTPETLSRFERLDGRLRVLRQGNAGLTTALIRGCEEVRGEFIARQDADDLSKPDRLRRQVERMDEEPQLTFCSSWVEYVGPGGELMEVVRRPSDPQEGTRRLLNERLGPPAHGSVLMRTNAYRRVGGYRPQFYFAQDSDLWLRLVESGPVAYVPEVLYSYRWSVGQISSTRGRVQWEFGELGHACAASRRIGGDEAGLLEQAAALTATFLAERGTSDPSVSDAVFNYRVGVALLRRGDPRARNYLRRAVSCRRTDIRAWFRLLQSEADSRLRPLLGCLRNREA